MTPPKAGWPCLRPPWRTASPARHCCTVSSAASSAPSTSAPDAGKACVSSLRPPPKDCFDHDNQRKEQCDHASNAADRSASTSTPACSAFSVVNSAAIASAQPRPGRNPYDRGSNRASPGSPGESHPRAPTDPDVNLSIHPAPAVQLFRPCNATTSARTSQAPASGPHSTMLLLVCRCVPAACTSSSPSASDGDPCACRSGSPRSGRTR